MCICSRSSPETDDKRKLKHKKREKIASTERRYLRSDLGITTTNNTSIYGYIKGK